MFDVIDDKPEGLPEGFIMHKHEPVGRGFIHYHINHERVYILKIRGAILHEGFICVYKSLIIFPTAAGRKY